MLSYGEAQQVRQHSAFLQASRNDMGSEGGNPQQNSAGAARQQPGWGALGSVWNTFDQTLLPVVRGEALR